METTTLARNIYMKTAEAEHGGSGQELADALRKRADELRRLQKQTHDRAEGLITPEQQPDVAVEEVSDETREDLREVLQEQGEVGEEVELDDVADDLDEASESIQDTVSRATNADLPEGVAGQARRGQQGSEQFDAEALVGEGETVVDKDMAEGVAEHEEHHTLQAAADVDRVTAKNGEKITEHDFTEAGAIAAQEKAAPGSIDRLSPEYLAIRAKLKGVVSSEKLIELSKKGELSALAA